MSYSCPTNRRGTRAKLLRLTLPALPRPLVLILAAALAASCQSAPDADREQPRRDVHLVPDGTTTEAVVPQNATLETLLRPQLSAEVTHSVIDAVRGVFNPNKLRAHRPYRITRGLDGLLREFRYDIDADNLLRVVMRPHDGAAPSYDVEVVPVPKEFVPAAVEARISPEHTSLIDAFDAAGENIQLPLQLAEVFGGEVDFNSDLRQGDAVNVAFERATREGAFVGYGAIGAAVLQIGGRTLTAIRYAGPDGKAAFYDEKGRSMRRQFLKSPLPFSPRVTSGFTNNRFHPVLGVNRPHLGVDFGAPFGTAVNAVAAGVVVSADWAGEAGRMVKIRHPGGYETAYLHLSSFGPGIKAGARVDQGMLIGRVGQSGVATGPHLDYRIYKGGVAINPMTAFSRMPQGEPIAADQLTNFLAERDRVLGQMQEQLAAATHHSDARVSSSR